MNACVNFVKTVVVFAKIKVRVSHLSQYTQSWYKLNSNFTNLCSILAGESSFCDELGDGNFDLRGGVTK